ncbi:MAG: protein translocase subunit SecD [Thermoleophilia bacterium]|nr:protein translocase subunit SecD [Thermoleophilia bacterium]
MSRIQRDAGILVLVAILLGVFAYFAFPLSKTNLGLDLQGGLAVILQAPEGTESSDIDNALDIIQKRVNKLGVAEPEIQKQGEDKISIQLPGIDNPEEALELIGKTAVLEFHEVSDFGTGYATEAEALAAAGVDSQAALDKLEGYHNIVHWPTEEGAPVERWYLVTEEPQLTGALLEDANTGYDQYNNPKVDMQFMDEGADIFASITTKLAETSQITGQDQLLAIVLDGEVESAPRVLEPIKGGNAEITGKFSLEEARNLALVLQTGALPVELTAVSQNTVGATLGKSALNQALIAAGVGLLLIMVFMIAYYRLLGVVASIALIIYSVLFLGILNAIGVTMTLPGIAGIILTLGMAVDANVLIFARMRDEVAAGKTVGAATSAGFRKAFRAVFDCNMTTIITAIILFWAATGGVKGFALTLGIGVALSFFTAVTVTRSILSLLSGWKPFRNMKLLGLHIKRGAALPLDEGGRS